MIYAPSLACANQLDLLSDIRELISQDLNFIHFDIMDGHFVPNLCLSMDTGKQLKKMFPEIVLDVHMMTTSPEAYVSRISDIGADSMTFHLSATDFPIRLIQEIKKAGMQAGVALNPSQPTILLEPFLDMVDLVLLMSIEPGFAGVRFLDEAFTKLKELSRLRTNRRLDFKISVDGGITPEIANALKKLGANIIVMGYPILFNQPDGITLSWNRAKKIIES